MLHAILAAFVFQEHLRLVPWLILDRTHLFFYFVQLLTKLYELRARFSLRMCLKLAEHRRSLLLISHDFLNSHPVEHIALHLLESLIAHCLSEHGLIAARGVHRQAKILAIWIP